MIISFLPTYKTYIMIKVMVTFIRVSNLKISFLSVDGSITCPWVSIFLQTKWLVCRNRVVLKQDLSSQALENWAGWSWSVDQWPYSSYPGLMWPESPSLQRGRAWPCKSTRLAPDSLRYCSGSSLWNEFFESQRKDWAQTIKPDGARIEVDEKKTPTFPITSLMH